MGDQDHIGENLRAYIQAFSPAVRDIFEHFEFHAQIERIDKARLLYLVTENFANIDLHPDEVSDAQMGGVFEELIRKFAELSNETAGEHFTPREVIRLMVNLLFIEDDAALTKPGVVRSLYDTTAGTRGMLSVAGEHLATLNPDARLVMYGQELNPESYANTLRLSSRIRPACLKRCGFLRARKLISLTATLSLKRVRRDTPSSCLTMISRNSPM